MRERISQPVGQWPGRVAMVFAAWPLPRSDFQVTDQSVAIFDCNGWHNVAILNNNLRWKSSIKYQKSKKKLHVVFLDFTGMYKTKSAVNCD